MHKITEIRKRTRGTLSYLNFRNRPKPTDHSEENLSHEEMRLHESSQGGRADPSWPVRRNAGRGSVQGAGRLSTGE